MKRTVTPTSLPAQREDPFYQCPHCHAVWLVPGLPSAGEYRCKLCGKTFALATARFDIELPAVNPAPAQRREIRT